MGAAAGVAAGTGAAQLGLGYGLGVVVWPTGVTTDGSVWLSSLGWATWTAATATVFGAVIAGRLGRAAGGPWRFALAASAAVGALLTVALIALPARASVRADTFSPETVAGGYAVIGVLVGLVLAYWAVVSYPAATNLIATAGWLWALAVAAVAADVFWHRPTATYLSSWQFVAADSGTIHWREALLTLLAAFILGVAGAWPAARRGNLGVGAASSGAVGPLLVAAAFFCLAPQFTPALGPLGSAYLTAPYAVLAGLAGSAATVALAQRRATRRTARTAAASGIPAQRPALTSGRDAARPAQTGTSSGSTRTDSSPGSAGTGAPSKSAQAGAPAESAQSGVSRGPLSEIAARAGKDSAAAEIAGPSAERQKPSLLGRLRRGRNGAERPVGDPASVATGRAQAPASARSSPQATAPSPSPPSGAPPSPASAPSSSRASAPSRETVARPPASPDVVKINPSTAEGPTPRASCAAPSVPGTAPSTVGDTPSPAANTKRPAAGPSKSASAARKAPAKRASGTKPASRSKPAPEDPNDGPA
ncbi:hypothetical protein BG844_07330 [Couchioplanes caeruleus subsp. caeruleus]|uniref:Uncharacterized protein n=1 Tax=Couchioplanes caeruleus subsp. caeruleus TaxID=56427 RepID=A0A1K0FQ46_9ACTN|nr:hypothetical protein BG844_07330 [Couchioplanes caeruleus subsp. caeruleus]